MRCLVAMVIVVLGLALGTVAWARGGQAADDCPAGSLDPDCKGNGK